jgi:hypothetical protein
MNMKSDVKLSAAVCCFLFLLPGCTYNPFVSNNHLTGTIEGTAIGAGVGAGGAALLGAPGSVIALAGVGGGGIGYYISSLRYAAGGVVQGGGKVYRVGDYVGIYIPTDRLFEPNSTELLPNATPILESAAAVLTRSPHDNILISGNTSGFGSAKWERKLSRERAKVVSSYLWANGINNFQGTDITSRKLNYVGYANYFPIATTLNNDGLRKNSYILITGYPTKEQLGLSKKNKQMLNIGTSEDA